MFLTTPFSLLPVAHLPSGPFSDDSIAMGTLGSKPKHMTSIFSLLFAILLGNLQITDGDAHNVLAHVSNSHVLDRAVMYPQTNLIRFPPEVRPTLGVARVNLLLPEEDEPTHPRAAQLYRKGKVVEHYSWKKVTTIISGFRLGSPTVDHYGDMTVCLVLDPITSISNIKRDTCSAPVARSSRSPSET
jgi:hypothetical protein